MPRGIFLLSHGQHEEEYASHTGVLRVFYKMLEWTFNDSVAHSTHSCSSRNKCTEGARHISVHRKTVFYISFGAAELPCDSLDVLVLSHPHFPHFFAYSLCSASAQVLPVLLSFQTFFFGLISVHTPFVFEKSCAWRQMNNELTDFQLKGSSLAEHKILPGHVWEWLCHVIGLFRLLHDTFFVSVQFPSLFVIIMRWLCTYFYYCVYWKSSTTIPCFH